MSNIKCGTCGEVEPLKWISVKDELPDPEVDVLIYCKQWDELMVAHIQNIDVDRIMGSFWFVSASENVGFEQDEIDWWMPLPEYPNNL